jgi:hypothetical protein
MRHDHPRNHNPGSTGKTARLVGKTCAMNDDSLITLKDACEVIFGGRVSPATLKDQWRKGNLDLSKIGRSYFASVADFKGLKTKCLADPPARASGSIRKEEHGLSSTVEAAAARDSLLMNLDKLKKPSGNTSRLNTPSKTAQRPTSPTFWRHTQRSTSRTK